MTIKTIILKGPDNIIPAIPDIAGLRLTVFREWPYLYDGDMADEEKYLGHFAASEDACVGLAIDGGRIVGATTAEPFEATHEDFRKPFEAHKVPTDKIFYFGESVLLPDYRGQGIGHTFFDIREQAARDWGAFATAFCAVQRPDNHPMKPDTYRPLDTFWQSRGYQKQDKLVCEFAWKDLGDTEETKKPMVFWTRPLE